MVGPAGPFTSKSDPCDPRTWIFTVFALSKEGVAGVEELALLLFCRKNVPGQHVVEVVEALNLLGGLLHEDGRQWADIVG
jgi:hypothetical protein